MKSFCKACGSPSVRICDKPLNIGTCQEALCESCVGVYVRKGDEPSEKHRHITAARAKRLGVGKS